MFDLLCVICQMICQQFNRWIIPCEGGSEFAVEESFQIASETDGLDGAKSVVGEGLARVDGGGVHFEDGGDAGEEEGLDFGGGFVGAFRIGLISLLVWDSPSP